MIRRSSHYYSANRTLWHHITFKAVHEIRNQQANENQQQAINLPEQLLLKTKEREPVLFDA